MTPAPQPQPQLSTHGRMAKHLRLGKVSEDALEVLKTVEGVKAIVLHKRGKKGEHPHWHVWMEVGEISHEAVRKRLRKHAVFATYSGNEDWSLRDHDSYDKWAKYVMDNPSAEVLLDNPESPLPPKAAIPIVAASGGASAASAIVVLKKPTDRTPQRVRFVKHLELKGWTTDCIKHWNLFEKLDELIEELTDWSENAFTTPNGAATVQHALWTFSDITARNTIKEKNKESLRKSIRLFS